MTGEEEVFDSMRSIECTCRSEARELIFQFLCGSMISICIISTDGVDNRCINRMNTHNNDFKERHDFGLF